MAAQNLAVASVTIAAANPTADLAGGKWAMAVATPIVLVMGAGAGVAINLAGGSYPLAAASSGFVFANTNPTADLAGGMWAMAVATPIVLVMGAGAGVAIDLAGGAWAMAASNNQVIGVNAGNADLSGGFTFTDLANVAFLVNAGATSAALSVGAAPPGGAILLDATGAVALSGLAALYVALLLDASGGATVSGAANLYVALLLAATGVVAVSALADLNEFTPFPAIATVFTLLAVYLPDEIAVGLPATIRVQYVGNDGLAHALDASPMIRIYSVSAAGVETTLLSTAMTLIGTATYTTTWTPLTADSVGVLVAGAYLTNPVVGGWQLTARARFDPIALAMEDLLVSRF